MIVEIGSCVVGGCRPLFGVFWRAHDQCCRAPYQAKQDIIVRSGEGAGDVGIGTSPASSGVCSLRVVFGPD